MIAYVIKSIVYLSIMYVPYMLLLRRESFFRFNRLMLIAIMTLSLVLPLCNFHTLAFTSNPISQQLQAVIEVGMPTVTGMSEAEGAQQATTTNSETNWWSIIATLYIIGMGVTIIVKTLQLIFLYRQIHSGVLWTDRRGRIRIYCHANDIAPFSWFHTIVISEHDYTHNAREILRHEMGHIQSHHSLDILLVNILQVIQWINPLAWILASSLRDLHEYEADDAVLRSGVNAQQYQSLLIKKAVGSSSYAFANSFNHSLLKKRITMMLQKKSNPWMRSKALYILPVACIALSAFATPQLNEQIESAVETTTSSRGKGTKLSVNPQIPETKNATATALPIVDEPASESTEANEQQKDDEKRITVIDGKLSTDAELKALNPNEIESVYVIKNRDLIKKYDANATVMIEIKLKKDGDTSNAVSDSLPVFDITDQRPIFEGGMPNLMTYLAENLRYPAIAQSCRVKGRVVLQFVVMSDGTVNRFKVLSNKAESSLEVRGSVIGTLTDDAAVSGYTLKEGDTQYLTAVEFETAKKALETEAIRVIKSTSGKWTPGEHDGKKVNTRFAIPITFNLQ